MKKITLAALLIGITTAFGQVTAPTFNRMSIDFNLGLNNAVKPFAKGYGSGYKLSAFDLGLRYMPNATFGVGGSIAFDRYSASSNSLPFKSSAFTARLQGYLSLGNAMNFYEFAPKFSLLAHGGFGLGLLRSTSFQGGDTYLQFIIGLTPQFKITNKLAVNLDLSHFGNSGQSRSFDGNGGNPEVGLSATVWTAKVGISYYLGKYDEHADWSPTKSVNMEDLDMMRAEMEKMRKGMNDDDADGVPNYMDKEPNTPAGNAVNNQGVTDPTRMDTDKDGIADSYDNCPEEEGKYSANGCPDMDGDGVADADDKCPNKAGDLANGGCPSSNNALVKIDAELGTVYFNVGKASLMKDQLAKVDKLVDLMNANPTYNVVIKGHADRVGSFELNQALSEARAQSVKAYLLKKGIDPLRITTVSYGASFPASKEETPEARSKNRRVEFEIRN